MSDSKTTFLEAAQAIGVRLCRDAIWAGERCNWLGDSMEFTSHAWTVVHRSFGPELYSGTSGIALFLARLHQATGEPIFRHTAEGAIRQALSRLEDIAPLGRIGFYSGWTGIVYALLTLGELFDQQSLIDDASDILEKLRGYDADQQGLDVVSGSAGAIPMLLSIDRVKSAGAFLDVAVRHGEHLLNTAHKSDAGWSWDTLQVPGQKDLTGFSHGTAGIGWALLELTEATGEKKYRAAAEQAFKYERTWFSAEHENWPDFRNHDGVPAASQGAQSYMIAWCHGAPGIALSRLRAYELTRDQSYKQEAEAALRTTARMVRQPVYAGQGNYSLCHGLFGNAESLIYASRILDQPDQLSLAEQAGQIAIETYSKPKLPWPCGVPGGGETPSLMLGTSGIGYYYLRLHDPTKVPSVIMISPK